MLGFCYVAGFSDLPASPWSRRQASLVSWKGMHVLTAVLLFFSVLILDLDTIFKSQYATS
jgi:nitrogen fixation protein FixH